MKRSLVVLILLSLAALAQEPPKPAEPAKDVDITWGVKIPMRDGVARG